MGPMADDDEHTVSSPLRVAYTVEQCWHPSPGGTAIAALRIARELAGRPDDVDLHLVAGRHPNVPVPEFRPVGSVAMLPLAPPCAVRGVEPAQLAEGRIGRR